MSTGTTQMAVNFGPVNNAAPGLMHNAVPGLVHAAPGLIHNAVPELIQNTVPGLVRDVAPGRAQDVAAPGMVHPAVQGQQLSDGPEYSAVVKRPDMPKARPPSGQKENHEQREHIRRFVLQQSINNNSQ